MSVLVAQAAAVDRTLKSQLALPCVGLLVPTVLFGDVLLWRLAFSERSRAEEVAHGASRALTDDVANSVGSSVVVPPPGVIALAAHGL